MKKVVKCNGGSGLLRDLPLVEEILRKVRAAISIPLTMKFRAGWNDRELVTVQMAQLAEDCGLQAVALHPRTREQGYSGKADWTRIAEVKAAVEDSGDRQRRYRDSRRRRPHGARNRLRRGDDRPHRFLESRGFSARFEQYLATGRYEHPTEHQRYEIMRTYYAMLCERGAVDAVGKMKQFATYFTHGVRNGSKLRVADLPSHRGARKF